jgi:hypothetical protein
MRGVGMLSLGGALLLAIGCQTPSPTPLDVCQKIVGWRKPLPDVKPPKHPEELVVPPVDDARYSQFPTFTPEQLDDDLSKKAPKDSHGFGSSPGTGGPNFGTGGPGSGLPGH